MKILLSPEKIEKIAQNIINKKEWVNLTPEFPNLRGVFSEKWGDPNDPDQQINNFINYFPTENQVILNIKMYNKIKKKGEEKFYFPIWKYINLKDILNTFQEINNNSICSFFNLKAEKNKQKYKELSIDKKKQIIIDSYNMIIKEIQIVFPKLKRLIETKEIIIGCKEFHDKIREVFRHIYDEFMYFISSFTKNVYYIKPVIVGQSIGIDYRKKYFEELEIEVDDNNRLKDKKGLIDISLSNDYLYHNPFEKVPYTRSLVKFYLKHIKALSRQDIARISKTICMRIIKDYYKDYYNKIKEVYFYFKGRWFDPELLNFRLHMFLNAESDSKKDINFHSMLLSKRYVMAHIEANVYKYAIKNKKELFDRIKKDLLEYFAKNSDHSIQYYKDRLSNKDIDMIIKGYAYRQPRDFIITENVIYYTIPRGGLEFLGIYMYINKLKKRNYTIMTEIVTDKYELLSKLDKLKNKLSKKINQIKQEQYKDQFSSKEIIIEIQNIIKDIKEIKQEIDQYKPNTLERGYDFLINQDEIQKIYLIDDYFSSGDSIYQLYTDIIDHFRFHELSKEEQNKIINQKLIMISITKRRNLDKQFYNDPYNSASYISWAFDTNTICSSRFPSFFNILQKSYYGIRTEDIRSITAIFPKIKQIIKAKEKNKKIKVKLGIEERQLGMYKEGKYTKVSEQEYFQRKYIDNNWLNNLTITAIFPHSIADGQTERLLRMLYGHRFLHSIKSEVKLLKNMIKN